MVAAGCRQRWGLAVFQAILLSLPTIFPTAAHPGGAFPYRFPDPLRTGSGDGLTVIGVPVEHRAKKGETLLDLAREYGLGFNELADLYPGLDPWVLPEGLRLLMPTRWVLPEWHGEGILINTAELRLYYFMPRSGLVRTYPIGIGDEGRHTPLGLFRIGEKRENPTWYIPRSLREKHGAETMPPGPDNPLGGHYMRLGGSAYGIHGTNLPWSVGRLVTHGCIRLYPEDIAELYSMAKSGTRVEIIYEPVKFGFLAGRAYVEVHRDIYGRIGDFTEYAVHRLVERGLTGRLDLLRLCDALDQRDGLPVDVTRSENLGRLYP